MTDKKKNESFIRSLCVGEINEKIIFPYPKMKSDEKESLKTISDSIESWLGDKGEEFRKWDVEGKLPDNILQEMREFGLFGLIIPEEHGGFSLSTTAYSRTIQELSKHDGSLTLTCGAHSSIGMRGLLMFGNDAQKKKYLPKLATGELIAAYCLTEAGSGSDAASIKTTAKKEGDHWILSGEKLWITNGECGDFFTVFAATDSPEGKMTAFLVTRDMGGVSNGPKEDKMGIRSSNTTTVFFDNVKVPQENVLGEVGKGFKIAMKILNMGRTGLGGGCVGGMKSLIDMTTKQAKERKQFGKSIAEFGMIKSKIGQMIVDCYAAESAVNMVNGLIDQGYEDYAVEAAISKIFATEALWRTSDEALQIAGGNGFMREFAYERIMRDCRINRIFEGTNEILRLFTALTAISDAGQQLKDLQKAVKDPIKGFGLFVDYAKKHMKATKALKVMRPTVSKAHPALKRSAAIFETEVQRLTTSVDRILRKHGKNIIGKQLATNRLANIIIDIFVMGSMLSRVTQSIEEKGLEDAAQEMEILEVFTHQAHKRISGLLKRIDDNVDEQIKSLSDHAVEKEAYSWDIL